MNTKLKIIFFGTSNVALPVLEALFKNHQVVCVVTTPDAKVGKKAILTESPVSLLAGELSLPVLKPENYKSEDLVNKLKDFAADIFIVVSYGKILPEEIINLPKFKTLNIHFSKLPKLRGASPIQYTLLQGEKVAGTSIFILDAGLDTGPVLAQSELSIDENDNFITLSQKMAIHSASLLLETLPKYVNNEIQSRPQNNQEATYSKIISKEDGRVNWQDTSEEIYNKFRAFYPWPGIWTTWQGKPLKITECLPAADILIESSPGQVLENGVIVCGKNTALQINRLQLSGKKEMDIVSFLNGARDFQNSSLN